MKSAYDIIIRPVLTEKVFFSIINYNFFFCFI